MTIKTGIETNVMSKRIDTSRLKAPKLKMQPGDIVVGTIVEKGQSMWDPNIPSYVIQTEDGQKYTLPEAKDLLNKLSAFGPGSRVAIKYLGKKGRMKIFAVGTTVDEVKDEPIIEEPKIVKERISKIPKAIPINEQIISEFLKKIQQQ